MLRKKNLNKTRSIYKALNIGGIKLDPPTVLAPLAGITNLPFRLLVKAAGCSLVCSEMISANGLLHRSTKTLKMLDSLPEEKPLSVQLFGSDPEIMAEAAAMAESSGADILDINFGCSVKKVIKTGAGAALMREPKQAEKLLQAVRKAIHIPLTIKMRTGWNRTGEQAFRLAEIAEANGVNALTLHPRTALQGFGGKADWSLIAELKKRVSVPVIGNGDIVHPEDAIKMISATECDAIMIGRAAIGNPSIFTDINALLQAKKIPPFNLNDHFNIIIQYVKLSVDHLGEKKACHMMRSRIGWFVKRLQYSSRFRESIKKISTQDQALKLIRDYQVFLNENL